MEKHGKEFANDAEVKVFERQNVKCQTLTLYAAHSKLSDQHLPLNLGNRTLYIRVVESEDQPGSARAKANKGCVENEQGEPVPTTQPGEILLNSIRAK